MVVNADNLAVGHDGLHTTDIHIVTAEQQLEFERAGSMRMPGNNKRRSGLEPPFILTGATQLRDKALIIACLLNSIHDPNNIIGTIYFEGFLAVQEFCDGLQLGHLRCEELWGSVARDWCIDFRRRFGAKKYNPDTKVRDATYTATGATLAYNRRLGLINAGDNASVSGIPIPYIPQSICERVNAGQLAAVRETNGRFLGASDVNGAGSVGAEISSQDKTRGWLIKCGTMWQSGEKREVCVEYHAKGVCTAPGACGFLHVAPCKACAANKYPRVGCKLRHDLDQSFAQQELERRCLH
jgi:hypothetical protein